MIPSLNKKSDKSKENIPEDTQETRLLDQPIQLLDDPDYAKLMEHYQKGEKQLSLMVLNALERRYPDHPELRKIREALQMKSSVKDLSKKIEKGEKRQKRRATFNLAIFAVVGTIIAVIAFYYASRFLLTQVVQEKVDQTTGQLTSLQSQAEGLLNLARPEQAVEIIATMRAINPDWEDLSELDKRAEDLLAIETQYNQALELAGAGEHAAALDLFKAIEVEEPGLWDVQRQITLQEEALQLSAYVEGGAAAYQSEDWAEAISAYENVLRLDPETENLTVKDQLIQAYLNEIIRMLARESSTINELEQAETYFRKAVALIPQSSQFAGERARLQELSSNLLEQKFTKLARDVFLDETQTLSTITVGVSYLKRAVSIKPRDTELQGNLANAQLYQAGFEQFIALDWAGAIDNFSQMIEAESAYLNRLASVLLYESTYALGKAYAESGLVEEAIQTLQEAESLAEVDNDNLLKYFQVELVLGDLFLDREENEAAYAAYKNAMEHIDASTRLEDYYEVRRNYFEAVNFAENGLYDNAYENYQAVFKELDVIYTLVEAPITSGTCLAFFASNNNSTIDAVNQANGLPNDVVITFNGILQVPTIEN